MDEPCSALDPYATAAIENLIYELADQFTIVIVTHNMQQASRCSNRTAFFNDGELVEEGETSINHTLAAYDKWHGAADGRIQVWFGPRTPGGVTPELYDRISALARERGMGITVHRSEVREDLDYARLEGYRSPTEFARAHGLLGPRTVLAHCVWMDERDWEIMAETGTHVAHNPASNSKCASGIAPVHGMLQAGANVTLGCDGGRATTPMT